MDHPLNSNLFGVRDHSFVSRCYRGGRVKYLCMVVSDEKKLEAVQVATPVRVRRGRVSTTDGPFAETNEQLGGFCLM